jgi:hypothetical protein
MDMGKDMDMDMDIDTERDEEHENEREHKHEPLIVFKTFICSMAKDQRVLSSL